MAFNVRLFPYTGIVSVIAPQSVQMATDSVFVLREPYIDPPQKLASNGLNEVVFAALPAGTKICRIEIDDGATIRYEVRASGNKRSANANSPSLSGKDLLYAAEGAVVAFIDATNT